MSTVNGSSLVSYKYNCDTETLDQYYNETSCNGTVTYQWPFAAVGVTDYECNATDCDYFMMETYSNGSGNATCDYTIYSESAILMDYCADNVTATCCDDSSDVCYQSWADGNCTTPFFQLGLSSILDGCNAYTVPDMCNATTPTTTYYNSSNATGCNGVGVDVLGIELTAPTDVCYSTSDGQSDYSQMYDCDTEMLNFYNGTADCSGNYTELGMDVLNATIECGASDCDYGILTVYNTSTDGECVDDIYVQVPFNMGCTILALGATPVAFEMYCASNESGSDVSAILAIGSSSCTGAGIPYPNALTAFAMFDYDATCMDMKCYQAGTVQTSFPTAAPTAPTGAPTESPTKEPSMEPNTSSATTFTVGLMSFCAVAVGLLR